MTLIGWAQIPLVLALSVAAAVPLGRYMAAVLDGRVRWLARAERLLHAAGGVDASRGQGWRAYTLSMLAANAAGFVKVANAMVAQGIL